MKEELGEEAAQIPPPGGDPSDVGEGSGEEATPRVKEEPRSDRESSEGRRRPRPSRRSRGRLDLPRTPSFGGSPTDGEEPEAHGGLGEPADEVALPEDRVRHRVVDGVRVPIDNTSGGEEAPRPPRLFGAPRLPRGLPQCFLCRSLGTDDIDRVRTRPGIAPGEGRSCNYCERPFHHDCFIAHLQFEFRDRPWFCRVADEATDPTNSNLLREFRSESEAGWSGGGFPS
mgnify:CR=1 FL=1